MFMEPKKLYWSKDMVDLEGLRAQHATTIGWPFTEGRQFKCEFFFISAGPQDG